MLCNESLRINNFLISEFCILRCEIAVKNAFLFHMIHANLLSQLLLIWKFSLQGEQLPALFIALSGAEISHN